MDNFCPVCGEHMGKHLYHHLFWKHGYLKEDIERIKKARRDLRVSSRTSAVLKCEECSSTFSSKSALTAHKSNKHRQYLPEQTQKQIGNSNRMKKVLLSESRCPHCDGYFSYQIYRHLLEQHFYTKTDIDRFKEARRCSRFEGSPYRCGVCGYTYASSKGLRYHMKTRHRDLLDDDDTSEQVSLEMPTRLKKRSTASTNHCFEPISVLDAEEALRKVSENNDAAIQIEASSFVDVDKPKFSQWHCEASKCRQDETDCNDSKEPLAPFESSERMTEGIVDDCSLSSKNNEYLPDENPGTDLLELNSELIV